MRKAAVLWLAVFVAASWSDLTAPAVSLAQAPQMCVLPPLNLVHWWTGDFDGSDVQNGGDGLLSGGFRAGSDGLVDGAFALDGVDGRLDIPVGALPNILPEEQFSVVLWFNPATRSLMSAPVIFQRERIYIGLSEGLVVSNVGGQLTSTVTQVAAGQWTHVALTYANRQLSIYVNGDLEVTATRTLESQLEFKTGIGYNSRFDSQFFAGQVDEVGFYDRALDPSEIASIFEAGAEGQCKRVQSEPSSAALKVSVSDIGDSVIETNRLVSSLGGRMERVYLQNNPGSGEAEVSFSIPPQQFQPVLEALEAQGEVTSRALRQGSAALNRYTGSGQEPDAQFYVSFVTDIAEESPTKSGAGAVVGAVSGVAATLLLFGLLLYLAFRAGYRRGTMDNALPQEDQF